MGSQGQQYSKKERMQWVGSPYPSPGRRSRINLIGLVKQVHTGIDTTGMGTSLAGVYIFHLDAIQLSSVKSHLFLSPIGARTLKMPVPYPPPNVEAYTQTPSHNHPACSAVGAQIISLRSDDLVVPKLPACGCG